MQSKKVLFSKNNPTISFVSRKIVRLKNSFRILGILTIKGILKNVELIAKLDSKNKNKLENASVLNFNIYAKIFRIDYGVDGYSRLVSDKIVLNSKITVSRAQ